MTTVTALENSDGVIVSKNPLEVIGWDYSILKLKLTEDEYHKLALRTAQTLAAIKHEDRTERKDISQHFNAAHTAIKDVEQFKEALNEFRQERNIQKRADSEEVQKLKGINQGLRAEVERLQKSSEFRGHGVEKLAEINTNLMKYIASAGVEIYNRSTSNDVFATNLYGVKSLDLLSIRLSGSSKKPGRLRPNEFSYLAGDLVRNAPTGIFRELGSILDLYQWGKLVDFVDRYVSPSHYVIIGFEKLNVQKGRIAKRVYETKGCRIIGTLSGAGIAKAGVNINRNIFLSLSKVAGELSPYIIDNQFLVVDRKPMALTRENNMVKSVLINIELSLEKKLARLEHSSKVKTSPSDLMVLGLILKINPKKK